MKQTQNLRDWIFRQVHSNNLVYNTCWEDPRCDRTLLQFNQQSKVVMITSAGCNALDYLLDDPASIDTIDMNPRQNALLELKRVGLQQLSADDFFQVFGRGRHRQFESVYQSALRDELPQYARAFWDNNVNYFNGRGPRKSFYHYGTAGTFAFLAERYIRARKNVNQQIRALFRAQSLEEQRSIYHRIEGRVLNQLTKWIVNRHLTMCLLGVPRSQQQLFKTRYPDGAMGFIRKCLRRVFTELPIGENYFYYLYLHGHYREDCCPNYLLPENQSVLGERADRIRQHTKTISQFLRDQPGTYSHYILLDHQDWLAANDRPALREEWELILANSRPGTQILLRSAAEQVDFFPDFVHEAVDFQSTKELAEQHHLDRVGTYASVYLGTVR